VSLPNCRPVKTDYRSKDGVMVPITIASPGQMRPKLERPLIMTSYGGFGVSMTPQFSVLVAIMIELGASFALPHIRGGGEFGKAWHDAARRQNRQTAFDDFISAGEWLCSSQITTPERLAIFGGSNSGLLVGAAITQRPDLFRAALCIAPLLDMVRYERFDQAAKWTQEFGTVDDPEDFAVLHAYSPYHHVAENISYPSVLFVSGDQDDRCNPAHVRKMAARLQERCVQRSAVIVDYSKERGHSPVLPLSVRIEALARRIAFLCRELNMPVKFGGSHETSSN
jgi:prolyl oligopeptidase